MWRSTHPSRGLCFTSTHARHAAVGATQSVTEREVRSSESTERCFGVDCLAARIRTIRRRKIPQVNESCSASSFHLYLTHPLDQWKSEPASKREREGLSSIWSFCVASSGPHDTVLDDAAQSQDSLCVHWSSLKCCSCKVQANVSDGPAETDPRRISQSENLYPCVEDFVLCAEAFLLG